ncbi:Flavin-dependent oxidoreductase, luciferase family (includes alkanesulfonate monooxygenase SsuD and methylene tetrahydromethanopterin reductase) [Rhodospirillales bacterium URHD0017]|nr:Flavin-dependent oxidoreductase, luciferase family (includes alkanesulfonate monooxygenase SsuD and methylene tetrahydromethanopterin reductase) [Rhodospirillales bacterium URHD0017]
MKVFVFDLLAYGENLDHLKNGGTELPYPLSKQHFRPEVAVRTYAEHLEAWEELDRLRYDGVGFNEHHCSPYGLMNSPNLMASAAAQRTKRLKLLIYGNLLPLHEPLRLAEELAMLDCLSNGRIISGFARGIPREYQVHNVPLDESRARFEEAYDIVTRAWTEDVFSYSGKFWSYKDVAIWPRPVQRPHPPVWIPIVGSKESIEFAGRHDIPITPGLAGGGLRNDIIRFYAKCLADAGHRITPDHMSLALNAYVADSKAQAVKEVAPYHLYFNRTLFSHGSFTETAAQRKVGYVSQASTDYVRPENQRAAALLREDFRSMTMADVERMAENMPWGAASEVAERIIAQAEAAGANTVQIGFNRGAMPHDMFMNQIRRFAAEVLPRLQAHEVRTVPLAAEAA